MEIYELPLDIQDKIISYLDIDTRRILGIYKKIVIPENLYVLLENIPRIINQNLLSNELEYPLYRIGINNIIYYPLNLKTSSICLGIKDNKYKYKLSYITSIIQELSPMLYVYYKRGVLTDVYTNRYNSKYYYDISHFN